MLTCRGLPTALLMPTTAICQIVHSALLRRKHWVVDWPFVQDTDLSKAADDRKPHEGQLPRFDLQLRLAPPQLDELCCCLRLEHVLLALQGEGSCCLKMKMKFGEEA